MTKEIGIQQRLKVHTKRFEEICGVTKHAIYKSHGYNGSHYRETSIPKPVRSSARYIYKCYDPENLHSIPTLSFAFLFLDNDFQHIPLAKQRIAFSYCPDINDQYLKPVQSKYYPLEEAKMLLKVFNNFLESFKKANKNIISYEDVVRISKDVFFYSHENKETIEKETIEIESIYSQFQEDFEIFKESKDDFLSVKKEMQEEMNNSEEALKVKELEKELSKARIAKNKKQKELETKYDFSREKQKQRKREIDVEMKKRTILMTFQRKFNENQNLASTINSFIKKVNKLTS